MSEIIHPRSNPDTEPYWAGCRQGRLLFQRCQACHQPVFHPRPLCPYCLSDALAWEESQGRGEIYSFTVQHVPLRQGDPSWRPRALGIIAMTEGYHIFAEITLADEARLYIGAPVTVWFDDRGEDVVLPKFRLAS